MTEPRLATLPARVVDARGVEYTAEGIIEAIRRWAGRHGEPPTVADRDPTRAFRIDQHWRAERFRAGEWPTADIVRAAFRTFNAAVEAAGMTPKPTPRRARPLVAMRPPRAPRTPDSASRLMSVAMAEAGAEVRRLGAEQIADQLRAVSGARRAGDPDALRRSSFGSPGGSSPGPTRWPSRRDDAPVIDEGTEFGARVARRLREEEVAWVTTVSPSGAPLPRPVWFLWDGTESVLVYSRRGARIRNIQANPRVTFSFDGDGHGGDIIVLTGRASVERGAVGADRDEAYLAKYASQMDRVGMSLDDFTARFPVPVRIRFLRLYGH